MSDNDELLDHLFAYHVPTDAQVEKFNKLRKAARELANVIDEQCPCSADRTAAMRQLQACLMTANRSIACEGRSYR